jgi:hypothetical protein
MGEMPAAVGARSTKSLKSVEFMKRVAAGVLYALN